MDSYLYSVRMRASDCGYHVSGAERIVTQAEVADVTSEMTQRALQAAGDVDDIRCSVERIDEATVSYARLPDLTPFEVACWREGRQFAQVMLMKHGVEKSSATEAVRLLADGPGPGGTVMRGAIIMDAHTGKRIEGDFSRGVRVSRMDLTATCRPKMEQLLNDAGLGHRRVIEALTLSGKVLNAPGLVAELCWSDDIGYTAGYVASPVSGYQRISEMKKNGDPLGGRVFFVNTSDFSLSDFMQYLEKQPVLFNEPGTVYPSETWMSGNG